MTLKGAWTRGRVNQVDAAGTLHGTFWRPDLSFDAERVLFSFHPANEKAFHIYEINVDGTGLRQVTRGIYDDVDPIYLPDDEHIIFPSTRGHNYVRCMPPTNSFSLTRCDLQGQNMYLISRNIEPDYLPSMLSDGRVIYTRWEYTDKPLWRAQSMWTMTRTEQVRRLTGAIRAYGRPAERYTRDTWFQEGDVYRGRTPYMVTREHWDSRQANRS